MLVSVHHGSDTDRIVDSVSPSMPDLLQMGTIYVAPAACTFRRPPGLARSKRGLKKTGSILLYMA